MNMRDTIKIICEAEWRAPLSISESIDWDETQRRLAAKLDAIIDALKQNPLAPRIRIFGSAITDKDLPGDIDAFFEGPSGLGKEQFREAITQYLRLGARGSGNYGLFDPFWLRKTKLLGEWKSELYVRNDEGTAWMYAQQQVELTKAGRAGVPVLSFDKKFSNPPN